MKVRVSLAEKGVEWDSRIVDIQMLRSSGYLELNPGGFVPTLADGDIVVTESRVISEYIDEAYPGPPLQPVEPRKRAQMRLWSKQVDDSLHSHIHALSFVTNFRFGFLQMASDERDRALPLDYAKRLRTLEMLDRGYASVYVELALKRFLRLIDDMDNILTSQPWLAGNDYSLADADLTPYLQRLVDVGLGWLWDEKPKVSEWFARVKGRPSFAAVLKNWVTADQLRQITDRARAAELNFRDLMNNKGKDD